MEQMLHDVPSNATGKHYFCISHLSSKRRQYIIVFGCISRISKSKCNQNVNETSRKPDSDMDEYRILRHHGCCNEEYISFSMYAVSNT